MPLFDTPPQAVDRVYAAGLFELAEAGGGRDRLESLSGELDELVELTRQDAQLSEFMSSRIIGIEERRQSLNRIFEAQVSELLLRFLQVLNRKHRLARLLPIVAAYERMVQERFGRIEIDVYTRHPLPADQLEEIRVRLAGAMQREPVLHAYTNPKMIGGVKMQVGDRLIDASVDTRLRKMRDLLTGEGATLLRDRFENAIDDFEQHNQRRRS